MQEGFDCEVGGPVGVVVVVVDDDVVVSAGGVAAVVDDDAVVPTGNGDGDLLGLGVGRLFRFRLQ